MTRAERMYELLPAIHRLRDAERGYPLRALFALVAEQVELLEEDAAQRYEDHFIETCAEWLVPYFGDLLGTTPLFDGSRISAREEPIYADLEGPSFVPPVALRARADVARTISFRRRKATLPMLEELARTVTGWQTHVVEEFKRLEWTQYAKNHLRPEAHGCPDLRSLERVDRLHGPFDEAQHNVDLRPIRSLEGWYNLKNIAFFVWRLISFPLLGTRARRVGGAGDFRYHASVLGNPAPLFSRAVVLEDPSAVTDELKVGAPIRTYAFHADLRAYRAIPIADRPGFTAIYGLWGGASSPLLPDAPDSSLLIVVDGTAIAPDQIRCMNLSTWAQPPGNEIGVDPRLGRIAFGPATVPASRVDVYGCYGFSGNLGGGPYSRRAWRVRRELVPQTIVVDGRGLVAGSVLTINAALTQWIALGRPDLTIVIADSGTYAETITIEPRDGGILTIEAADLQRPHLLLGAELSITGDHPDASITFSGLLIEGFIHVTGALGRLRLLHSTLVPGRALTDSGAPATNLPSVIVEVGSAGDAAEDLELELAFSIAGPLVVPARMKGLVVVDSIVDAWGGAAITADAGEPGPSARLERTTIFGSCRFTVLSLASEVIFDRPVFVEDRQQGCVRYSYVPLDSRTPKRFRCHPDPEIDSEATMIPSYTSTHYGEPAYAQLHVSCPLEIAQGAEDGSEMGAFCHLKQPQRLNNLRTRLLEYLPFGLEPGIILVS